MKDKGKGNANQKMHFRLLYVLADLCLAGLNKSTGSIIQDIQCPGRDSNRSPQNRRHKIYRQSQTARPVGYSKIRNSNQYNEVNTVVVVVVYKHSNEIHNAAALTVY